MKVLMISSDKGLLGKNELGDAIERHRRYGTFVERLDILVLTRRGYIPCALSEKVNVIPTNSFSKFFYYRDGKMAGRELFSKNNYNLVVAQDPFMTGTIGLGLKNQFKKKLLVHCHGDFFDNPYWLSEHWYNRIFLFFASEVVKEADGIRVMSRGQKEKFLKRGISEKKIRVISTPVDIERFARYNNEAVFQALREKIKASGRTKFILFVGRKDPVKDFDTLFSAMKIVFEKNNDAGLWLVGNFRESEISKIPLDPKRIIISEREATVNLAAYYALSYLAVLSSTSESFGKVLVEAGACEKPIVATETTGAKEIVEDGYNGFLAPIGDYEKFAEKILYLLQNPVQAKEMGGNGRKRVFEKFDGKKNTEKIIQFWKSISEI